MQARKKIRVEVHFTPSEIDDMALKDKNVVVIDVLRASTTVATALHNGAKEIIPVNSIENVIKISSNLFGDVTLRAGERNGKMIEGFNLGNSPLEYTAKMIKGKSIILMTTNGSMAIVKGKHAKNLVVAGFINLGLAVRFLTALQEDIVIVCSGKDNTFCIEDAVCAGRIVNDLTDAMNGEVVIDDAGNAATMLDKSAGKNLLRLLKNSEHGQYLTSIGFGEDLKACAELDSIPVLPVLSGNILRPAKEPIKRAT
jgi:2-phosphosulfolactate phosphatase